MATWQWGELHQIEFKHFFDGVNPVIDNFVNIGPFPIGGDGTTVFNTEYSFTEPYLNKLGPSMRYIYDFSEKINSITYYRLVNQVIYSVIITVT